MSITNYTELQASVASWLHRSDLASVIPDFITLAENRLNGDLMARPMEVRTTLTCVAGTRTLALPSDMLEMKRLTLMTDPTVVLEYKSPDQLLSDQPYVLTTGIPTAFTVITGNVELAPTPDSAYSVELIYIQKIPPLASNSTNWLLTASPNAYLFGALIQSIAYTQDEARAALWEQKYREAVNTVNGIDWYSGSTMRVKAR